MVEQLAGTMAGVRVANDKGLMTILVAAVLVMCGGGAASEVPRRVPAVYVFGDSTVDVGNNGPLPPPYGIDFPHPEPTGRVSNGYNVADAFSRLLGFEMSPPAYKTLTPETSGGQILRGFDGVNYASGGSGILDTTVMQPGISIPFSQQVEFFADTMSKMAEHGRASKGSVAVAVDALALLPHSLFLISSGGNDMFLFILQNRTLAEVPSFYADLLSSYTEHVRALYDLGARHFGILDVPPVGCVPLIRNKTSNGECRAEANTLASGFNFLLRTRMALLAREELPEMKYSVGSSYNMVMNFTANPEAAGFRDVTSACCGGGGRTACVPNATVCENRDDHLYWDVAHSSQATAIRGAAIIFSAPVEQGFATPINFEQLVSSTHASDGFSSS